MERENKRISLRDMREKRGISEALFKKFTEVHAYFGTHAICFYEGEDGKYYNMRVKSIFGEKLIAFSAGNKKEVLKIMNKISSDPMYADVCTMYFVDKDYDESLAGNNEDLFETPCYSVENLYAQECVFSRILQSEFGLNEFDDDYIKCMDAFNARQAEFNQRILKFNAIVKYQHQHAPHVCCRFSNIKTSHIANISLEKVVQAGRCEEILNNLFDKLSIGDEDIAGIEEELKEVMEPQLHFRGKNQLDFMVAIIELLKKCNQTNTFFSKPLEKVYVTISGNRLSELSQYAVTPDSLKQFLSLHRNKLSV